MLNACLTICLILLLSQFACSGQTPASTSGSVHPATTLKSDSARSFRYRIITVMDGKFGYDVYMGESLFIHQTTIPAVTGSEGFTDRNHAEAVARLVVSKLNAGEMPPTISIKELEAIGWRGQ